MERRLGLALLQDVNIASMKRTLELVPSGGTHLIDDLFPQPGWLDGHGASAKRLLTDLEE